MLAETGLFFIEVTKDVDSQDWVIKKLDAEIRLENKKFNLMIEYANDEFITCSFDSPHFVKVNR